MACEGFPVSCEIGGGEAESGVLMQKHSLVESLTQVRTFYYYSVNFSSQGALNRFEAPPAKCQLFHVSQKLRLLRKGTLCLGPSLSLWL